MVYNDEQPGIERNKGSRRYGYVFQSNHLMALNEIQHHYLFQNDRRGETDPGTALTPVLPVETELCLYSDLGHFYMRVYMIMVCLVFLNHSILASIQ